MKIDLTNLFNGSQTELTVNHSVDLSDVDYGAFLSIKKPVKVSGRLFTKADVVYIDITLIYTIDGFCDRCAEAVKKDFSLNLSKTVVKNLQNNNNDDDYIVVENQTLDLDKLVNEEVSLNIPSKLLCRDDCKGLCMKCGTNLNVSKCDCKGDIDPRMEALLQLLDKE